MKKYTLLFLFALLLQPFAIAQESAVPQDNYTSLGTLEVKVKNRGEYPKLQLKLDKILLKEAVKKYGADSVINMVYWPSPDSDAAGKYLYARGEMIRFKKFTAPESSTA